MHHTAKIIWLFVSRTGTPAWLSLEAKLQTIVSRRFVYQKALVLDLSTQKSYV